MLDRWKWQWQINGSAPRYLVQVVRCWMLACFTTLDLSLHFYSCICVFVYLYISHGSAVGSFCGQLLTWSWTDQIFLAGNLSHFLPTGTETAPPFQYLGWHKCLSRSELFSWLRNITWPYLGFGVRSFGGEFFRILLMVVLVMVVEYCDTGCTGWAEWKPVACCRIYICSS